MPEKYARPMSFKESLEFAEKYLGAGKRYPFPSWECPIPLKSDLPEGFFDDFMRRADRVFGKAARQPKQSALATA